jgi:queuine tRNA-ribosyltransferase
MDNVSLTLPPGVPLAFTVTSRDPHSRARTGMVLTPHGKIETPMFMPVGTQASVKALAPDDLHGLGATIILSNTYHLSLRPGPDLIASFGGLHQFMQWNGPVLTDSGGFQVFSLGHLRSLTDDGVAFRSHLDGSTLYLDPERVMEIEAKLGADIILPLDECPPYPCDRQTAQRATERTHRWAERALAARVRPQEQALFGIPQGGMYPDMRVLSAQTIGALPFDGISIGGLSVGEPKETMWELLNVSVPALPDVKPRHLLGVGSPEDLVEGVMYGIDLFDCVLPTRVARNGGLYTDDGRVNIRASRWREVKDPILVGCDCWTCQRFSAGYLHHLARASELLFFRLASIHNLRYLIRLMSIIRTSIQQGTFLEWRNTFLERYHPASAKVREEQKEKWLARHGNNPDRQKPS